MLYLEYFVFELSVEVNHLKEMARGKTYFVFEFFREIQICIISDGYLFQLFNINIYDNFSIY